MRWPFPYWVETRRNVLTIKIAFGFCFLFFPPLPSLWLPCIHGHKTQNAAHYKTPSNGIECKCECLQPSGLRIYLDCFLPRRFKKFSCLLEGEALCRLRFWGSVIFASKCGGNIPNILTASSSKEVDFLLEFNEQTEPRLALNRSAFYCASQN